ncbi:MAG: prepilin-type N-terminal cleavage/methylation domain-containing protein [Rhodoferax sp.]
MFWMRLHDSCGVKDPRHGRGGAQRGFTLTELIMVMVLVGVLAVVAAPRIFNTNDFNGRGFHDETLAMLRYAQKTAIAQRRTVCVTFGASTLTLAIAAAPATSSCAAPGALRGPNGAAPVITAKSTVTYANPAYPELRFDGLGQPLDATGVALAAGRTLQVSGAASTITVEAVTGYVHE